MPHAENRRKAAALLRIEYRSFLYKLKKTRNWRVVPLCYECRAQQNGRQRSWASKALAILIRIVAMELGLCRSARARRAAGLEVGRNLGGA